jgi:hypothetical protein
MRKWKLTYWPGSGSMQEDWHKDPELVKKLEKVHIFESDKTYEELNEDEDGPVFQLTEDSDGCELVEVND